MYLQPYRPTLLELEPCAGVDLACASSGEYLSAQVATTAAKPKLWTFLAFCAELDKAFEWQVGVLQLSQRQTPFVQSSGKVRVCACAGFEFASVWDPADLERLTSGGEVFEWFDELAEEAEEDEEHEVADEAAEMQGNEAQQNRHTPQMP
eukprot:4572995-Amphidinium_carterae.1